MRHNHYTPQQYLLGFADPEGRVWLHDNESNSGSRHPGVRVIGNELGLYSDEVETNLAKQTEQPGHAVFDKVIDGLPLTATDRSALAKYIIVLWKRVPVAKERSLSRMPVIIDKVRNDLMAEIDAMVIDDPTFHEKAESKRLEVTAYIDTLKADPPSSLWYDGFSLDEITMSEEALLSMNWVFLRGGNNQFLTSDNPVFFFPDEGLGRPQSELTFPISSSIALWATRLPRKQGLYMDASLSVVRQINARTAENSKRFMFSKTNDAWIKPFTIKGGWLREHLK
jgi:hypothetical protein